MAPSSGLIRGVAFDWMTLIRGGTIVTGYLPVTLVPPLIRVIQSKTTPLIRPDEGAMGENLLH
jgi:hypothetical protein